MTINFTTGDIETVIMAALKELFQTTLIDNQTDGLQVKKLIEMPLQDDPTRVAPYVVYGPSPQIGRMLIDDASEGGAEIGSTAPQLWETFFTAQCGTPRLGTRADGYSAINELSRRVERAVITHFNLAGVLKPGLLYSDDYSEWVDAMNPHEMWKRTIRRVYGGGNEYYGRALMIWSYKFYRATNYVFS